MPRGIREAITFQSGTPTSLIDKYIKNNWEVKDLEGSLISKSSMESGDVLGDNLELTCYYTGYLTIKGYDPKYKEYTLGYPNTEVRNGFFNCLLQKIQHWNKGETDNFIISLRKLIDRDDIDGFLQELQSFLAGIPYMNHTNTEPQWQKNILIIARLVGMNVEVERRTSYGRIDMILDGTKSIYIIEFKYGGTPEEALAQINERDYALPFQNSLNRKSIVKVGVNISPETRNIDGWIISE